MRRSEHGGSSSGVDLTDAVTVFVTTVGAPTFDACLAHLRAQDCRFTQRVIAHVAPMPVAFQRMLDECQTPYYVQVDEDMLLHPFAVRVLHERIAAAEARVALVVADLFDVHLQRCILGVKIFRHAIVRDFPFSDLDTFETDQVRRLEAAGYALLRDPLRIDPVEGQTLGLHGTAWTPQLIYERYLKLERRRQLAPPKSEQNDWLRRYGGEFLDRFRRDPSEENFFALMGLVAGVLSSRHGPALAKDFRTYESLPGFAALRAFLAALAADGAAGEATGAICDDGAPAAARQR